MTEATKDPTVVKEETAKRLTLGRLVGKVQNVKKKTPLAEIAYHVNNITTTDNPDDPGATILNLSGEFRGVNLETGDIVNSGQATLPSILSRPIQEAKGDLAPNITGRTVIGVEPKDGGGVRYYIEHKISPERRSVLAMLESHVTAEKTA